MLSKNVPLTKIKSFYVILFFLPMSYCQIKKQLLGCTSVGKVFFPNDVLLRTVKSFFSSRRRQMMHIFPADVLRRKTQQKFSNRRRHVKHSRFLVDFKQLYDLLSLSIKTRSRNNLKSLYTHRSLVPHIQISSHVSLICRPSIVLSQLFIPTVSN